VGFRSLDERERKPRTQWTLDRHAAGTGRWDSGRWTRGKVPGPVAPLASLVPVHTTIARASGTTLAGEKLRWNLGQFIPCRCGWPPSRTKRRRF
jgi:hypothetical protein